MVRPKQLYAFIPAEEALKDNETLIKTLPHSIGDDPGWREPTLQMNPLMPFAPSACQFCAVAGSGRCQLLGHLHQARPVRDLQKNPGL